MAKLNQSIVLSFILILLSACGGGGGGDGGDTTSTNSGKTANTGYTVGGAVSGLSGTGLILQDNGGDDLAINADGAYTFGTPLADGTSYTVSIAAQPSGQVCSLSNASATVSGSDVTNVDVACVYTVGGVVSGLVGNSVTIQNNGGDDLTLSANGDFTFATTLNFGDAYAVTVKTQPGGMMCSIQNGSGTVGSANIDNVIVNCSEPSLNQAVYDGRSKYVYGYGGLSVTLPNIKITGSPADADWTRWAMLHDNVSVAGYRLYCFKAGTNDTLYQFVFNALASEYQYGYSNAIKILHITGTPPDADPSSFAMLYEGVGGYHLYMRSKSYRPKIYQFIFNGSTYAYADGVSWAKNINSTGAPADVDWDRWAMLGDTTATTYREYAFKKGSKTIFYQFGYNGSTYKYHYDSLTPLTVEGMPDNSDTNSFAMLHDGKYYRFYFLAY